MQNLKKFLSWFTLKEKIMVGMEIAVFVVALVMLILAIRDENAPKIDVQPSPSPTPTDIVIFIPKPTNSPTPSPSATPTVTPTPTPTPTLALTQPPKNTGYDAGKPGAYICETNGRHKFKPYTDYRNYNAKGTKQHALQKVAMTDNYGIRTVVDIFGQTRYCIALGTAWAGGQPSDIGRCIDIHMENGAVLYCVLADVKKVEDTYNCRYGRENNDLIEFIVDEWILKRETPVHGDVSAADPKFEGEAKGMVVHDYFIEGFGG